jgi:hypothetical protein
MSFMRVDQGFECLPTLNRSRPEAEKFNPCEKQSRGRRDFARETGMRPKSALRSPLPYMTRGVVMTMVSLGVGHEQPAHPAAQITVGPRPHHPVEVIGHQPVSQDIDGQTDGRIDHGLDQGVRVGGLMEDRLTVIAAIEDMIPHAGDGGSCGPGHGPIGQPARVGCKMRSVPFSVSGVQKNSTPALT